MFATLKGLLSALPSLDKATAKANYDALIAVVNGQLTSKNFANRAFIDLASVCEPNHVFPLTLSWEKSTDGVIVAAVPDVTCKSTINKGLSIVDWYFAPGLDDNDTSYTLGTVTITLSYRGNTYTATTTGQGRGESRQLANPPSAVLNPGDVIKGTLTFGAGSAVVPLVNSVLTLYLKGAHIP